MTIRLYEQDGFLREFEASVTNCVQDGASFWVILDQTAFFPESGGQSGDRGTLNQIRVLDTQLTGDEIRHKTGTPIEPGSAVKGVLDWDFRFSNMQNHTGEHILSGVVHSLYGCNNVGFHMDCNRVTVDFDRYLTSEEVAEAERKANQIIWEDRPVTAKYLHPGDNLNYRSKKEITGLIRLVTIQNCDCCACCVPHVRSTGQVGLIKILGNGRHRRGTRIQMVAGKAAFNDYRDRLDVTEQVSHLLSAKQDELSQAVQRILEENQNLVRAENAATDRLIDFLTGSIEPTEENLVLFPPDFTTEQLRRLCNAVAEKTSGVVAAFSGGDNEGYTFVIVSRHTNLVEMASQILIGLDAKGGGSAQLFQGSCVASERQIRQFFSLFLQ